MARWSRIVAPGLPIHVTQRGHNRDITFHDEEDFACFREILHHASRRAACAVHAYVLMSNHVHVLLTPSHPLGPARMMQCVGSRFVRFWNRRHRRTGTLWDGRFKSSVVDTDRYFLTCTRYIDMNPVRAGMVTDAARYEWSSYRQLAHGIQDDLLTLHPAYKALADTPESRHAAYRAFCQQPAPARATGSIRHAIRGGGAVGEARFLGHLESTLKRPVIRQPHGGDRRGVCWLNSQR